MKLIFKGTEIYIRNAVNEANKILTNPVFYEKIKNLPKFDNTFLSTQEISDIIKNAKQEVEIITHRKFNPFRRKTCVNATTVSDSLIKLNTRCFSTNLVIAVNTLIHESVHAADFLNGNWDFTHVDNSNDGEEDNTAPWAIGALAKDFVENR